MRNGYTVYKELYSKVLNIGVPTLHLTAGALAGTDTSSSSFGKSLIMPSWVLGFENVTCIVAWYETILLPFTPNL